VACDQTWLDVADFDSETLYGWRRDAEGTPAGEPAIKMRPGNSEALGFFHLLLRQAGAQQLAVGYEMNGLTIRVLNGAGAVLGSMRSKFVEPPVVLTADVIVAVGATDFGLPGNVVRQGRIGDVVRPEAGGVWFDVAGARAELNL
jgi:hypothetical protein